MFFRQSKRVKTVLYVYYAKQTKPVEKDKCHVISLITGI